MALSNSDLLCWNLCNGRACLNELPGLSDILKAAFAHLGHPCMTVQRLTEVCIHIHFLLLDMHSQVDFDWHEDTWDISIQESKRNHMLSIITQLSATFSTAMQVFGFGYHEYAGQGAGTIFQSRGRCGPHSNLHASIFHCTELYHTI